MLFMRFLLLEAHEIPTTTTLLGSMLLGKFNHLASLTWSRVQGWVYRSQRRFNVVARRVTHSHQKDEQNIAEVRTDFVNYYYQLVKDLSLAMDFQS